MKRRTRLLPLLVIALLALGFAPGDAGAQDEDPGLEPGAGESYMGPPRAERGRHGRHGHHGDWKRGRGPGRMGPGGPGFERLHMALRNLDLSDSERTEIRAIFEQDREQAMASHERMAGLGRELEQQIESDPLNEEAIRAKAAALASLRVEMAVVRARQVGRVRQVLTPEQLDRLEGMKAEREALREERRERFGERRGPRSGS